MSVAYPTFLSKGRGDPVTEGHPSLDEEEPGDNW